MEKLIFTAIVLMGINPEILMLKKKRHSTLNYRPDKMVWIFPAYSSYCYVVASQAKKI